MRQLSARERRLLLIAAAALVVFVYVAGVILPLGNRSKELSQELELLKGQAERAEMMYAAAETAASDIAALREQTEALMFVEGDVRVGMVRELESLARQAKLTITSIRPDEPQSIDGAVKYPATVKAEAEFSELVHLMFDLEQPSRRLWVEGVDISAPRRGEAKLQATFYVVAYAKPQESEEKDVEA